MKKILKEYGWTILASIVVLMLMCFSSPIGTNIRCQISSTVLSFGDQTQSKIPNLLQDEVKVSLEQSDNNGRFNIKVESESITDQWVISYRVKSSSGWGDYIEVGNLSINDKTHEGEFKAIIKNKESIQVRALDKGADNNIYYESNIVVYRGNDSLETKSVEDLIVDEVYAFLDKDGTLYLSNYQIDENYKDTKYKNITWYENLIRYTNNGQNNDVKKVVVKNTLKPTTMLSWFRYMNNIESFEGLNKIITDNVVSMQETFNSAGLNAENFVLDLSSWNTSNVTTIEGMFANAGHYSKTFILRGLNNWDTSNVTTMRSTFIYAGCSPVVEISDLSTWNTSKVADMQNMFNYAFRDSDMKEFKIDISNWDVSNVQKMNGMFCGVGVNAKKWSIGSLTNWDTGSVTTMAYMFTYVPVGGNIGDLSNWDVSNVTDMESMFMYTGSPKIWTVGDLSNWNTSNVTNMSYMFANSGMYSEGYVLGDISKWDVSKVTNMDLMFQEIAGRVENFTLNLSNWNTSSLTSVNRMFFGINSSGKRTQIDISGWDLSNITSMNQFFDPGWSRAQSWEVLIPSSSGSLSNTNKIIYGSSHSINYELTDEQIYTLN